MFYVLTFLLIFMSQSNFGICTTTKNYPIGGLFNTYNNDKSKQVYSNIVKTSNVVHGEPLDLKALEVTDSYSTALEVCDRTTEVESVIALIDARPTFGICDCTCILCNRLNITHLSLGWQVPELRDDELFTFSYYPPGEVTSKAFATLIKDLQWEKFTVLYENEDSFIRIQEVINTWQEPEAIVYRKLYPKEDNRETFKHIFKVGHMSYHILDCEVENTIKYFQQIVEVENSTQYLSFILTSLEAYTLNIKEEVPELMANVSTFHMMSANDSKWRDYGINEDQIIPMETALTVDALNHLQTALRGLSVETNAEIPPSLCFESRRATYDSKAYPHGYELREIMLNTTIEGFTGNISFDEKGRRINFKLLYSKLNNVSDFEYTGYWDPITNTITTIGNIQDRSSARKTNSVYKISSKIGEPYFMEETTNDTIKFVGYAVDLIKYIFEKINENEGQEYKYQFYKSDVVGNPIEGTKKWNGIIGELMEHNTDMAICDLTITSDRYSAVDFSVPFMSLGISIMYREPDPEPPDMFSFILPLNLDVWLYLATTYIIVSFVLFLCARMSQDDWVNPHPCNQDPENYQNIWSLYNCMWLTMGSIMTQGCDILPRAAGSRWTTGVWWFFALIITASYTANMSTFLSNSRRNSGISSAKDLADQTKVSYGAMENGSTYKFFRDSQDEVYSKLWSVMSTAKPSVFTNSNPEGKDRVLRAKGKYAFFMESTAIEYYMHSDNQLKMVGPKLDSKEYGIAFPKKSPLKAKVDAAILTLQEKGVLEELKKTWWETQNKKDSESKDDSESSTDNRSLQMDATAGIFMVLGVGGVLGLIVAIIDFMLHANQIAVTNKISFKEALATEWKSSLDPRTMHKPAVPQRSRPNSIKAQSRERSRSRAASLAASFINFDEIY